MSDNEELKQKILEWFRKRSAGGSKTKYYLKDVLPGLYLLESFRDWDGDGRYSLGRPFPFKPSERFVVYQDTVRVRSRWPNEGNDIILPWK